MASHDFDIDDNSILSLIDDVILSVIQQISDNKPPVLSHFNRGTWQNITYDKNVGLCVNDAMKMTSVRFDSKLSLKKFTLMIKLLSMVYSLIQTDRFCTKRDLYYQDTTLFGNQTALDEALENISCMLQVPRWRLHVLATSKGCIAGNLSFYDVDGNYVDCSKTMSGIQVPSHIAGMQHIQTDADFILVIEKDAIFQRLLSEGFCEIMRPCIIVTGKGFPDMNTRMLLNRLWREFSPRFFILVDADPYGIEIMSIYKFGSRSLSFEAPMLTVPDMEWLGVLPSDIQRLQLKENSLIELKPSDKSKISNILARPYVSESQFLYKELNVLLELGKKAEIESLDSISLSFLANVYLPTKMRHSSQ
ncbi:meiotic recombination protein SPO11-like [Saccostrea echinata]|uniref:meiotic recombination protein SPO11-like n=1 Tax=Saccostrea echinata TaxID=191078 RepID=UPI002A80004A|nr:meiotic recombination protein SPO11-like [Saccostrea echinata]